MTDMTEERPILPDRPGGWYLDLLGLQDDSANGPPEPARSQSAEMSFLLEAPSSSVSTPTPLEVPREGMAPRDGVAQKLEPAADDLTDWAPEALAKQVASRRNFRWTVVISLSVLVVGFVLAVLFLPTLVESSARDEAADYQVALTTLRETLPEAQQALASATDPRTSTSSLFSLAAELSRLDAASREVATRAARPLPDSLPLLPRGALEDLVPTRERMTMLGDDGISIATRLAAAISYRTTLDAILMYPSLPVRADASQINGLSITLAATLANSVAVLADLPLEPTFAVHRLEAEAALERFGEWQTDYLDALRRDDTGATAALIAEVQQLRIDLFDAIFPALAATRSEIDADIIALDMAIARAISDIPRP